MEMVRRHPVDTGCSEPRTAKIVACAQYNSQFRAGVRQLPDFTGDPFQYQWIDTGLGVAHQRLAAELQQDTLVADFRFCIRHWFCPECG